MAEYISPGNYTSINTEQIIKELNKQKLNNMTKNLEKIQANKRPPLVRAPGPPPVDARGPGYGTQKLAKASGLDFSKTPKVLRGLPGIGRAGSGRAGGVGAGAGAIALYTILQELYKWYNEEDEVSDLDKAIQRTHPDERITGASNQHSMEEALREITLNLARGNK